MSEKDRELTHALDRLCQLLFRNGMKQNGTDEAVAAIGLQHLVEIGSNPYAPLLVLVHGRAGNREVVWLFRRSAPPTWNVISFEAPVPDPIGGFSWWLVDNGQRDSNAAPEAWQRLSSALTNALLFYGLQPAHQFALGFSQGSAILSIGLQKEPELFDGVAILAGFVPRRGVPETSPGQGASTSIFWAHGRQDEVIPIERAREDFAYLQSLGFSGQFVEEDVGHKIGTQGMRALKEWFLRHDPVE